VVWTGYAVLVTSKTGRRRVEVGPTTLLLDYEESLEALALSTGKPKTTDKLLETPFLRVENNQVTDVVEVETLDHVFVQLRLSYRVDFEGDALRWFTVENYVKFMCDHVRSVLKGQIRKVAVEAFYASSTDRIRDLILGVPADGKRAGLAFPNGMRIVDGRRPPGVAPRRRDSRVARSEPARGRALEHRGVQPRARARGDEAARGDRARDRRGEGPSRPFATTSSRAS
jgi:hypothetical protein